MSSKTILIQDQLFIHLHLFKLLKHNSTLNTEQIHFLKTVLFLAKTEPVVVIPYRSFGSAYRSHLQGSRFLALEEHNSHLLRAGSHTDLLLTSQSINCNPTK